MKAVCVIYDNPFDPSSSQIVDVRRPMRVRALVPKRMPCVARLNGRMIMRAEWRRKLRRGDELVVLCWPAGGGGGGGGGSNPLRTVLTIALIAFAPALGGALFGGIGGTIFGISAAKLGTLAIVLLGSAAINALFPVPTTHALPAPSPTYSLGAQGNAARLGQPIAVQYGRMLSWPDLAAQPYTEYAGQDQYLYQLLCLGAGEFDIHQIRIEDTPISSFSEIETQIVAPGEQVTLFPTAVVTSTEVSGQELVGRATLSWVHSGTTVTFTETGHSRSSGQVVELEAVSGTLATQIIAIDTIPDADSWTITIASGSGSGSAYVRAVQGGLTGYVASAAGTVAHHLGIDLIMPLGLYGSSSGTLTNKSITITVQAQQIDETGTAIGSWLTLDTLTITDRSNTPIRKSQRYELVTPGRYQVRAWRVDAQDMSTSVGHQILLGALRAYLRTTQDFGPVTLIAMRARATNNLSLQASRRISVISTRKLPVWNGTSWSAPVATRSIAWAIADAARNVGYGPGLPDTEVDLSALLALEAIWAARGDSLDVRLDQSGTWWDTIQSMARAGRAQCFMQGGILRTVRDSPASVPVQSFSERNMKRGSFVIDYLMPTADTADSIKIEYFDSVRWAMQSVTCTLPGSTATKPSKVSYKGITERAQVNREGLYLAACNRYRRRIVRFTTEMEGRLPMVGELIAIQHSMPGWGQQAEARSWAADTRHLRVSEPLIFDPSGIHYAALRRPDGSLTDPIAVTAGATPYDLILAAAPGFTPETGSERERSHVLFGVATTWSAKAKVARIDPKSLTEYDIQAVIEDPAVHLADQGIVAAPVNYSQLPRSVTRPVVSRIIARRQPDATTRALFSWTPAANADSYQMEMAEGDDPFGPDVTWTRIADTTSTAYAADLLHLNRTMVRIRAIGLTAGPWLATTLGDLIPDFWLSDLTPFWLGDSDPFWSN
ncbi:MAG: host specificity factor TipJ family phage tail protein [Cypionkella sp.]